MKKLDTRITSKRKLTAKEYGEAVRNHYLPHKQQERLDIFFDIVNKQIKKRKADGFKFTEFTNLHQAVSLDEEYFKKLIDEIEDLGTSVEINLDTERKIDKVKIQW